MARRMREGEARTRESGSRIPRDPRRALRESEARSRALMQACPDMLMRVQRDGCHIDVHIPENIAQFLPMGRDAFLGKRTSEIFEPEFAAEHERLLVRALETGKTQRWQYSRRINGQTRYLEARFVRSGDDEVVIAITDVTDRVDLEREAVNAIERERNRIGRDLHDGLGQLLTGIKLILEPVRKQLETQPEAGSASASANVEQALELIGTAIAQTSELARGLSPMPKDGGFTFAGALEQLAAQATRFFRIDCAVTCEGVPDDLGDERSINLYRIAQEALTNAVRHGQAANVRIDCRRLRRRLMLTIEDDGVGFAEPAGPGMGLHIMHYRARALGGEVMVGARDEGGTRVRCYCPLA